MLNLIVKDIVLQRRTILFGFLYVALMMFAFNNGGPAMFTAAVFAATFLMIQTPCAYDEKSRAEPMLISLPIRREMIVSAKYASVPLWALISALEYLVIYAVIKVTGLPLRAEPMTLENLMGMLFAIVLFASVFYPIFFRFGYMKTRYVNIFLFAGLFAGGSAIVLAVKGDASLGALADIAGFINGQPQWAVACALVGLMLGLMLISYIVSVRFYKRREF